MPIMKSSLFIALLMASLAAQAAPETVQNTPAFVSPAAGTITLPDSEVTVANLPRLRSQDPMQLDSALAAYTVAQDWICRVGRIKNCAGLAAEKEASPLSVAAWADLNVSPSPGDIRKASAQPFSGTAFVLLKNIRDNMVFYTESCYPYDRLSQRYKGKTGDFEALLTRVHAAFLAYRTMHDDGRSKDTPTPRSLAETKGQPAFCEECLLHDLRDGLLMAVDEKTLKSDLKQTSYGDFMLQGFFGQCHSSVSASATPGFDYFPDHAANATEADKVEDRLHDIIVGLKVPVALDGVCMATDTAGQCARREAVTVTGYRKVCRNTEGAGCEDAFRIRTAGGKQWQDAHDGGWVLAAPLFRNTLLATGTLSWYPYRQ